MFGIVRSESFAYRPLLEVARSLSLSIQNLTVEKYLVDYRNCFATSEDDKISEWSVDPPYEETVSL